MIPVFFLTFLSVCFALIMIQRDLTIWQKFSLILNPALLCLIVLMMVSKNQSENRSAAELSAVVNEVSAVFSEPEMTHAKKAAQCIRKYVNVPENQNVNWTDFLNEIRAIRMDKTKNGQK